MKKSHVGVVLGIFALILMSIGCSSLTGEKWAAKVNGDAISVKDYNDRLADVQKIYESQGTKFDTDQGKQTLSQIKSELLSRMIESKLMAQEVKNLKLNTDSNTIKEQEATIKKNIGDDTKFQTVLKQQGMSEQDFKNFLAVYEKETADVKSVTDTEVKAYFDKNSSQYGQAESVTARHILVKTEAEAKAIIEQLDKGADFVTLAKEKSIDESTKKSGGDLGTFTKGKMVSAFETAAFSQEVGTYSKTPVKTEFGYHIIYVEAHTPAKAADFDQVKSKVVQDALNAAKDAKFQTYFTNLRKEAKIEYAKGYEPVS